MDFDGNPILIEFDTEGHVHQIMTLTHPGRTEDYDVDWVEDYSVHMAHNSGSMPLREPIEISPWVDAEHKPLPTYYWAPSTVQVEAKEHCHCLSAQELLTRLLPDEEQRKEWLINECTTIGALTEEYVPQLLGYWGRWGNVWEGETVYCSIDEKSYSDNNLCEHIEWCDVCTEFSTPDGECTHRTEDRKYYVEPEEDEEENA